MNTLLFGIRKRFVIIYIQTGKSERELGKYNRKNGWALQELEIMI